METYLTFIFIFAFVVGVMWLFVRISLKARKNGGSLFFIYSGATDEMYTTDKKKAIEMIVEKNADKKMEEQFSTDTGIKEEDKTDKS